MKLRRLRAKYLINLIMILCTLPMEGVEIFSRKYNSGNGLPDNNVRFLLQDKKGFIWMGTPGGLYRYDGYFFTAYKYEATGNAQLLNNNHITGLYKLPDTRILIAEQGGLFSVFDIDKDRFADVADEYKQELYDACRKGSTGNLIHDNLGNEVEIGSTGDILYRDRKTGETISMHVFDKALIPVISSKKYKVITSEKLQQIWVSTNGYGITIYDRKTKTEQHIHQSSGLISTDFILDMILDKDDNIWVADEFHGVVCLSAAQPGFKSLLLDPDSKLLRSNQVYIMQQRPDSTLVVANTLGDIYITDRQLNIMPEPAYKGIDVHALCYDKMGRPWIGTRQRGIRTADGQWLTHDEKDEKTISDNNIYNMVCDKRGRIWAAPENAHLDVIFSNGDGQYSVRHLFSKNFSAKVMLLDHNNMMWIGTKNGLYYFSPDKLLEDSTSYRCLLSAKDLSYSDVNCIYEDSRHQVWIGTGGSGLFCISNKEDQLGNEPLGNYTQTVGLSSSEVHAIIEDRKQVMWFATKKGITCYNPQNGSIDYHYDEQNLMRNYYVDNSACILSDGRLAFGTNAGIVVFQSGEKAQNRKKGLLTITDILVNGEQIGLMGENRPIDCAPDDADELRLSHDQNSLTVRFSDFSYQAAGGTRYAYYLEGYDRGWSELSTYSFASYKHLEPGRYVLHVKAYGTYMKPNQEKTLTIIIARPWWATWWAYLLYLLIGIGIGYAIFRHLCTVYRLRQRISVEKQLTEYKLQFFTNISHEFRTPLTIIRGAMERIKKQKTIPAEMRQPVSSMDKSVSRMLRLINQLLEFRKMQNDKLRLALEETDVVKFLKDIFQNFWDIADNKQINYQFLTQEKSRVMFVDRSHLDKMVYNILSNAFKYTPSHGDIIFQVRFTDSSLIIRIEDTGVGIPKEKQPELFSRFMQSAFSSNSIGIGLNLTKALAEVHHGRIEFEPNLPKGSVFTIELPTDPAVYDKADFLASDHQLLTEPVMTPADNYQELALQPMNDRDVLIVEDDFDVIDYLRSTLQRYFVVHTAMDGVEALETLEHLHPDLIISDIMMPVMDGLELASRLRANEATKDTPIILLTALTSDDSKIKGVEKGADAYITKPFDPQLLVTTAVRLVQQRDQLKDIYMQKTADSKAALPEIITDERDRQLLDVMNIWLSDHLSNPLMSVDDLAAAMGYSRTIFFKKVKALTGQTPADYIKTLRMNRAAELLKNETVTVAEVCYQVGISDPHYFAKVFRQQFGISPKKYQQGTREN